MEDLFGNRLAFPGHKKKRELHIFFINIVVKQNVTDNGFRYTYTRIIKSTPRVYPINSIERKRIIRYRIKI